MSDDDLDRLQHEQHNIRGAYGLWGTDELAAGCSAGAAVPGFGGDPDTLDDIAANLTKVYEIAGRAWDTLRQIRNQGIGPSWTGDTHVAASDAASALFTDIQTLTDPMRGLPARVETYADRLRQAKPADADAVDSLDDVAGQAARMTALGFLPDLTGYDGDKMADLHHLAMAAIDARVDAHLGVRDAGRRLASVLRDQASHSGGQQLGGSPLSALDDVVLAEAGNTWLTGDTGILTPSQERRAAAALSGMSDADRRAVMRLMSTAVSPEQRAYLVKMVAAGYPAGDVSRFDALIAAHGDDPEWLAAHLGPVDLDAGAAHGADHGRQWNEFDGATWTQGQYPTCVASSTVAARAAVDPLYALQLTTGGHPGDPAFDNPQAFADRLRAEQSDVYDDGRNWVQKLLGEDGMTDGQSTTIADQQIASHTGATYHNVDLGSEDARYDTIPRVEKAVDDGYPVPVSTRSGNDGHQMMIVGHQGDQFEIYNPWGYTYWVGEDAFAAGQINGGDADLPGTPVSVRLPQGVN
jgi:hypothetical protein